MRLHASTKKNLLLNKNKLIFTLGLIIAIHFGTGFLHGGLGNFSKTRVSLESVSFSGSAPGRM